jgi:uncharacterized protein YegJ (DUF2314 family)
MRGVLVLVVVLGCKTKSEPPKPPPPVEDTHPRDGYVVVPGTVRTKTVDEGFIVVVPKGGDPAATKKLIDDRLAAAHVTGKVEVMPAQPPGEPDREMYAYANPKLTDADLDGITTGTQVMFGATGEPIATLKALMPIARDAATAAHGWVIDPLAGGVYTPAEVDQHTPGDPLDVRKLIYVHGVQGDNAQPFLDTMGMKKLGFPELTVTAAASGQMDMLTVLIDATAQQLVDEGDFSRPGAFIVDLASLKGEWHLDEIKKAGGQPRVRWNARWRKQDGGDLAIQLTPPGGDSVEAVAALLDYCFGKAPDPIANIKADDPELKAAGERARKDLVAQRAYFAKGIPAGEQLAVKAPFHTPDDQVEWMWVDVVAWKGDTFSGTLDNDPELVKSLHAGSQVSVKLADVADFIHVHKDGSQTGGYSVEVMKKRGLLR